MNERTFPVSVLDEELCISLEDFKRRGLIHDYRLAEEILTLWRPWIEGQTQEEVFDGLQVGERIRSSQQLFRVVHQRLRESGQGHGALHPRNIILRQSGFELVDAIFNRACLSALSGPGKDSWLWGPCLPEDWDLKDWDLISLLRTAALLAQDPSTWRKLRPVEEVAEICRKWAEDCIRSAPGGADFVVSVRQAMALLQEIVKISVFPLEEKLANLAVRQGRDRMLRQRDEDNLADLGVRFGLGREQFDQRLRVWMLLNKYRKESELRSLAGELLKAGLYGEKLVSSRACAAAERTFTHYGVDAKEAAGLVQQFLAQGAWLDERRAGEKCRQFLERVSEYPEEECIGRLAMDFAEDLTASPKVARRIVDLEFERRLLGLAH